MVKMNMTYPYEIPYTVFAKGVASKSGFALITTEFNFEALTQSFL
jgi:hypothetical protein